MFLRTTSSVLAVLALTAPAFADVTPAEVWQNWIEYYKANGYTVTEGSRDEAGETLTLKDVVIAYKAPDDAATVQFTMPQIVLTGTGDGKVRTTMSETSPATATFKDDENEPVTLTGSLTLKDAEIITAGSPGDMTHDSKAAELVATLDNVKTSEKEQKFPFSVKVLNATTQQRVVDGDLIKVDATMAADRIEMSGSYDDTAATSEMPGKVTFDGAIDGVSGSGTVAMPKGMDPSKDMNAAMKAGMAMTGTLSAKAGRVGFDYAGKDEEGKDQSAKGAMTVEGVDLTAAMSAAGLKYQGSADATSTEFTASEMPFPFSYAATSTTFDLQMPIMKSDTPAPFKFAYSIGGLTIADGVWDLFDSGKVLPRDPANLDIDITGLAKVTMDLFDPANLAMHDDDADSPDASSEAAPGVTAEPAADPSVTPLAGTEGSTTEAAPAPDATTTDAAPGTEAPTTAPDATGAAQGAGATTSGTAETASGSDAKAETSGEQPPFEPTEITLNKLALDAAGAKIDASGSLAVPEGGSMDAPVGKVSARLEGVNGLIDKLVQIGVVPEDQVAGYRMMLAMFAKPEQEGKDSLVSELEFKDNGQVFANGQQVK